ncbi:MAG: caspase family protein, partial [Acidobacteria bacterium]|nr:caspase family protein [Acidobacteriota bacterium]
MRLGRVRRLALLVATYRYQNAGLCQLTSPAYDADALANVLRDPDIAGFDVTALINEPQHVVWRAIGEFYKNRHRDDLTFLYFTGHGVKDDFGRLYFAMTDTQLDSLLFTALSAQQVNEAIESCSSRQNILVLDCCYSGSYPADRIFKGDPQIHALDRFQGKGRVVLAASDSTQYSFEGSRIAGEEIPSVFTRFLVEGLVTGKGDLDGDGNISLDELYEYVYERVIGEMPQQRPKKLENVEGRIIIARNVHWSLPAHIRNAVESPIAKDRLTALESLAHLYRIGNDHVRFVVRNEICRLIDDDSKAVSVAAADLIRKLSPGEGQRRSEMGEEIEQKRRLTSESPEDEIAVVNNRLANVSNAQIQNASESQNVLDSLKPAQSTLQRRNRVFSSRRGRPALRTLPSHAYQWLVRFLVNVIEMRRVSGSDSTHSAGSRRSPRLLRRRRAVIASGSLAVVAVAALATLVITAERTAAPSSPFTTVPPRPSVTVDAPPAKVTRVPVGVRPFSVAVTPDGRRAFATNADSGTVSMIDIVSGAVTPITVGATPDEVAITPDGRYAYINNHSSNDVSIIDTAGGT